MNDTDNVLIQTIDLTEYYGSKGAVEGLDFTVRAGEIFGFLGPNGAGKTTTMKMIVGLLRPTRGEALVGGHNVQEEPIGAKAVSRYLPEEPNLYPKLSGRECLSCVGDLFGMATAQIAQRSEELLRIFDLDEAADNYRFVQPRDAAEDRYCRCSDARPAWWFWKSPPLASIRRAPGVVEAPRE